MPKNFSLEERLDWATGDAEDGARYLRQLFDDFAFDNENLMLDGEEPMLELNDAEMKQLDTAEVYLLQAARRISEIKTTLATLAEVGEAGCAFGQPAQWVDEPLASSTSPTSESK